MELKDLIETECARFGVPGAAVSVVADGDVVLADGFGLRDETDAVTSSTLYMLASDTKCFAALTLCLLVDDGLLDLDTPVREYLPWFEMHDRRVSGLVTSRDLLAHRTGLPRHDFLTVGNGDFTLSNKDIARRMRHLEPSRPFRQGFGYNNAHYATAGHVVEVVTGQPWRHVLAERVLQPLGMGGTSTYAPALTSSGFAAPYVYGARIPFQTREYDLPSGGMVTHADDLGRWLRARVGRGAISREVLALLHTPAVLSGQSLPFPELESMGYALGNMVFSYRGHRLHLHGGSQLGYSSQVIVVPDALTGVAVLTNSFGSRLPLALGLTLVDQLLGLEHLPWGERLSPGQPAAAPVVEEMVARDHHRWRDLRDFAGTYRHPAYGDFSLTVVDGTLRASFHGLDDDLLMTRLGEDDWQLSLRTLPSFQFPVGFRNGADGGFGEVALGIEPELNPLVFARR